MTGIILLLNSKHRVNFSIINTVNSVFLQREISQFDFLPEKKKENLFSYGAELQPLCLNARNAALSLAGHIAESLLS